MAKAQVFITRKIVDDCDHDASYLEQDGWKERLQEYRDGGFSFVGVQAVAEIRVPYGKDWVVTHLASPGLWSIESDSGEDYFNEVYKEERNTLVEMLDSLHKYEIVA